MFKLFGANLLVGLSTSVQTVVAGAVFLADGRRRAMPGRVARRESLIPIPTQLVDAGLMVARVAMPEHERDRHAPDVAPWMPMVVTVTHALSDLPDGTVLVSVDTAEETCASRNVAVD